MNIHFMFQKEKGFWLILLSALVLLCVNCIQLGRSHPCGKRPNGEYVGCAREDVCHNGWCVPKDWKGLPEERNEKSDSIGGIEKLGESFSDGGSVDNSFVADKSTREDSFSDAPENLVREFVYREDCAFACKLGETKTCYGANSGCNVQGSCQGICKTGKQYCYFEKGCSVWSECLDFVAPTDEVCNNKDDDCDGQVDEELKRSCYEGSTSTRKKGSCRDGEQSCSGGRWEGCKNQVLPKKEICNGADDNCDGRTDEGCSCASGAKMDCGQHEKGECEKGQQTCDANGQWGVCVGKIEPVNEVCNNKDDDCDGLIDNGVKRDCYSGKSGTKNVGVCKEGTQSCTAGLWGSCVGDVTPTLETCDGKDNDCDGSVDESDPILNRGCTSLGVGYCKPGLWKCVNQKMTCTIVRIPKTEVCTNNVDDDCDGKTDEGCVTTFAGIGTPGFKNGSALQAQFESPVDLAFDSKGNLYVADEANLRIRKVDASGNVTTFAGVGTRGSKNGSALQAQFNSPISVVFDGKGSLFVADINNNQIRKIDTSGNVTTYAGNGTQGFKDGPANQAQFGLPGSLVFDDKGNLYISDINNHRIRKVDTSGNVTTFAGNGTPGFKNGPALQAQFDGIGSLTFDAKGNLYVVDVNNFRIRKVDINGNVTTFAGNGVKGFKNGPVLQAQFDNIGDLVFDGQGNLYVADAGNHRIRKVDSSGNVTTFAGNGIPGSKDGDILQAQFHSPLGLAFGSNGKLYLSGGESHQVKVITLP